MHAKDISFGFADLNEECLEAVFSHLPPASLGACMAVNKQSRDFLTAEDSLWQKQCEAIYRVSTPTGPDMQPLPSFRAACGQWHLLCLQYGSFALRALHVWADIKTWLAEHSPVILQSLRPGATEAELDDAENQLGVKFSTAMRVLYRIHDGQELEFDRQLDNQRPSMGPTVFHGLFGGYSFYSHVVSTRMLPLRRIVRWTKHVWEQLNLEPEDKRILFAAGFNFNKMIFCYENAQVSIAAVDKFTCMFAMRGAPIVNTTGPKNATVQGGYHHNGENDIILAWFEAYAAALSSGQYGVKPLYAEMPESDGISLFPQSPPGQVETITQGIRVRASPVFIPELSEIDYSARRKDNQYFFAYNIGFSIAAQAGEHADTGTGISTRSRAGPVQQAQLRHRHWVIRNERGEVESEIRGEAVVGNFPIVTFDGPEFTYQSCTHQHDARGSMEGDFTFVEGTIENPGERVVSALCPQFRLDLPPVMF